MSDSPYREFRNAWAEIADLNRLASLAHWDMQTYMPAGGTSARGEMLSTLSGRIHTSLTEPRLIEVLETLYCRDLEEPRKSAVALALRECRRSLRIPASLVRERALAQSAGFEAWIRARDANDFDLFLPALKRVYEASRNVALAIDPETHPLQTLLDERERGFTLQEVEGMFAELKATLIPMAQTLSAKTVDDSILRGHYPISSQWELGMEAARLVGFDLDGRGRQDRAVHPFTASMSPDDVRITTRFREDDLSAGFFATLHEAGHGIYEQNIPVSIARTPLGAAPSGGIHESQSRLWENIVGRSPEFWDHFFPRFAARFPEAAFATNRRSFVRAVNRVQPSLIRVEADEVTYNLHIAIRFELESAIFKGDLALEDLPEAWNHLYMQYLGIMPPDPLRGVLQDVHWSSGIEASFVGYTLGNIISAQLFRAASQDAGVRGGFEGGYYTPLLDWMRQHVHRWGQQFDTKELVERATGEPPNPAAFLEYLREKMSRLFADT